MTLARHEVERLVVEYQQGKVGSGIPAGEN